METPFFTPGYVGRSTNLAYSRLVNLYPEIVETRNGKNVGAFYLTPSLNLFSTLGGSPINGIYQFQGVVYAIGGSSLYSVSQTGSATFLGNLTGVKGPVAMVDNGVQLAIFTTTNAYVIGRSPAAPLTGGTLVGGSQYAIGDQIQLAAVGGTTGNTIATAVVTVNGVSGSGAVTAYSITQAGAFLSPYPTSFVQASTTGDGNGFSLSPPSFGTPSQTPISVPLPYLPYGIANISACQMDGYIVINQPGTYILWQSNELDATTWQGLNFASASGDTDNVIALWQQHREIFVIKQHSTQIFVNGGAPGFVFQNLTDVFVEQGTIAQNSVAPIGETILFLAQSLEGSSVVVQMRGYTPTPVSTHAISHAISEMSWAQQQAAVGFSYTQEQHAFYVLTVGNKTFVYDAYESELAGVPMWHERAAFLGGQFSQWWANSYLFAYGLQIVGDYRTGNLYSLDLDAFTDNGTQRKWLRSWRALPKPSFQPVRFTEMQIDMQTGIDVPNATNPQVMLRWSDDGGHNWANQIVHAAGMSGQTALRVKFNRMGSTRRATGLDRIFELSSTDMMPAALIGADLR